MRKIITLVLASAFVLGMFSMSSCSNKQELLHGKWSITQNEFEDVDGETMKQEFTRTFDFKDDGKLTETILIKIDGETATKIKIDGTYEFNETDLDGYDNAIGIISMNYDLNTLNFDWGDMEMSDADKAQIRDSYENLFKENNRQGDKADKKNENSLLEENFYGLIVTSLDDTDLVIYQGDQEVTYIKQE